MEFTESPISMLKTKSKKHPTIVVPSLVSELGKQMQEDPLQVRDQTDLHNEFEVSKGCIEKAYIIKKINNQEVVAHALCVCVCV